jgi:hypothetical protein
MYIPEFAVGVVCGVVGLIIFEIAVALLFAPTIEDEKEEEKEVEH